MHTRSRAWSLLITLSAAGFGLILPTLAEPDLPKLPELTDQNRAALHAYISPKPEEVRWREIPWRTSLWDLPATQPRTWAL